MGLREAFEEKKSVALGGAAALILVGVIGIAAQLRSGGSPSVADAKGFFTVDDGKTYFEAAANSSPPFEYKGKPAVKANVFEAGGKQFVGYLERFTPEAQRTIHQTDELFKSGKTLSAEQARALGLARATGTQVKRPGDKDWVVLTSREGAAVTAVKPPSGTAGEAVAVTP